MMNLHVLMIPTALYFRADLTDADRRVYGALNSWFENITSEMFDDEEFLPTINTLTEWTALTSEDVFTALVHLGRLKLVALTGRPPRSVNSPMKIWALNTRILSSEDNPGCLQVRHLAPKDQAVWEVRRDI